MWLVVPQIANVGEKCANRVVLDFDGELTGESAGPGKAAADASTPAKQINKLVFGRTGHVVPWLLPILPKELRYVNSVDSFSLVSEP